MILGSFPQGENGTFLSEHGGLKNYSLKRVGRCSLDTQCDHGRVKLVEGKRHAR